MSTVDMQVLSNAQLIVLTILMFFGGQVFASMVGLYFKASKLRNTPFKARSSVHSMASLELPSEVLDHIEREHHHIIITYNPLEIQIHYVIIGWM